MEKKIMKIKSCVISGQRNLKENICRFFTERKYISGITVIERKYFGISRLRRKEQIS